MCRWAEQKSWAVNPPVASNSGGLHINSNFDSGNVDVVNMADETNIELNIHEDPYCETDGRAHFQCTSPPTPPRLRALHDMASGAGG